MVHTELTDELHETLSEEIFWMMTHREHEFMKFAQKLRDNIRKKWKLKPSQIEPLPATDGEILAQLRDTGQRLLQFRFFNFSNFSLFNPFIVRSGLPSNWAWSRRRTFASLTRPNSSFAPKRTRLIGVWCRTLPRLLIILTISVTGRKASYCHRLKMHRTLGRRYCGR